MVCWVHKYDENLAEGATSSSAEILSGAHANSNCISSGSKLWAKFFKYGKVWNFAHGPKIRKCAFIEPQRRKSHPNLAITSGGRILCLSMFLTESQVVVVILCFPT